MQNFPEKHIWRFFAVSESSVDGIALQTSAEPAASNSQLQSFALGDRIVLSDDEGKLLHVLRLTKGQNIELSNGCGRLARAQIEEIDKRKATVVVQHVVQFDYPIFPVRLFLGRAKQSALEESIESAAQLGCMHINVVDTAKTSSTPGKANRQNLRFDRLEKIAREAVRISKNPWFPKLETEVIDLEQVLQQCMAREIPLFICDEAPLHQVDHSDLHPHLLNALEGLHRSGALRPDKPIALLIGPESGFSAKEKQDMIESAADAGQRQMVNFVSLGNYILTVPNAVRAAVTLATTFAAIKLNL